MLAATFRAFRWTGARRLAWRYEWSLASESEPEEADGDSLDMGLRGKTRDSSLE